MCLGEVVGVLFNCCGEFDWVGGGLEVFLVMFGVGEFGFG